MMVRVELGVNRSMEEFATPCSGASYPDAAQAGEHQSAPIVGDAAQQTICAGAQFTG
jgi:hypothetical protein